MRAPREAKGVFQAGANGKKQRCEGEGGDCERLVGCEGEETAEVGELKVVQSQSPSFFCLWLLRRSFRDDGSWPVRGSAVIGKHVLSSHLHLRPEPR